MKLFFHRDFRNELTILACGFISYFLIISLYVESLSGFINEVGVQFLPVVLLIRSLLFIAFTLFNVSISARYSMKRIFSFIILLFGLLFALLTWIKSEGAFSTVYFYFITSLLYTYLDSGMVPFAASFTNPVRAKSFLPLLSVVGSIGLISGSYLSPLIHQIESDAGFGYLPTCLLLLVSVLISSLDKAEVKNTQSQANSRDIQQNLKSSFRYVGQSSFFRSLTISVIILASLQHFVEFKQNTVLTQTIQPESLDLMFSRIFFAENILRLAFAGILAKRILFRFGSINAMLAFPVMMLASLTGAFIFQWNTLSTILVYLTYTILYFEQYQMSVSQLTALIPTKFTEGVSFIFTQLASAIGAGFASLVLMIYYYDLSLDATLNSAIITLSAAVALCLGLRLKKLYRQNIQTNVFSNDAALQERAVELLAEKNEHNRGEIFLRRLLKDPRTDQKLKERIMYSLSLIDNPESAADMIEILETSDNRIKLAILQSLHHFLKRHNILKKYPLTKHRLLDIFKNIFISPTPEFIKKEILSALQYFEIEDVIKFLETQLKSEDVTIQLAAIETLAHFEDRSVIHYLRPFLKNPDPHLKIQAIAGLWKFPDFRSELLTTIGYILSDATMHCDECIVFLIDHLHLHWEKDLLRKMLRSSDEKVEAYAIITLIKMGEIQYIDILLEMMIAFQKEGQQEQLEIILSKYRALSPKTKQLILKRMHFYDQQDIECFYKSFAHSRYVFYNELDALKA